MRSENLQFQYVQYMFNTCRQASLQDSEEKGSISTQGLNKTWASLVVFFGPGDPRHTSFAQTKAALDPCEHPIRRLADQNKSTAYRFSQSKKTAHCVSEPTDYDLYIPLWQTCQATAAAGISAPLAWSVRQRNADACGKISHPQFQPTCASVCVTIQNELGKIRAKSSSHRLVNIHQVSFVQDEIRCPTCNLNRSDNARFPPALSPETTTSWQQMPLNVQKWISEMTSEVDFLNSKHDIFPLVN